MCRSTTVAVLILGYLAAVCSGVSIRNLSVPQTYVLDQNGDSPQKPLILDCEFETDPSDTGIVLKWNFNNFPIYQWIPGSHPIPLQRFKPHLDTTYTVSSDPKQKFRALSILNPSWNMTGNYSCSLQSFQSSDQQTAELIVIHPETEFELELESSDENDTLVISCDVKGIFPRPRLTINVDGHRVPGEVTDNESTRPRHGLYEMTNRVTMNKTAMHVPATVNCVLEIPETEYEQQRSETFNEVTTTTTTTAQTLTYKDGESDETNQISRLEAVVGSHERSEDDDNGAATTLISSVLLVVSTMFLRYMA